MTTEPELDEGLDEPVTAADVPGVRQDQKLREYWVHGKGALKIRWGQKGDWRRCIRNVRKYSKGGTEFDPEGYCANLHKEALGVWPGREHAKKTSVLFRLGGPALATASAADGPLGHPVKRDLGLVVSLVATVPVAASLIPAPNVLSVGDSLQVIGANAAVHSAKVVDLKPLGDLAESLLICDDMREANDAFAADSSHGNKPVAIRILVPGPEPATASASFLDIEGQAFLQRGAERAQWPEWAASPSLLMPMSRTEPSGQMGFDASRKSTSSHVGNATWRPFCAEDWLPTAINPHFEELHPRRLGRFTEKLGTPDADELDLGPRIKLGTDERLLGSETFEPLDGPIPVAAWISGPAGVKVRLGIIPEEDVSRWGAEPKGATVELDEGQVAELRDGIGRARATLGRLVPEAEARQADLIGQRNRILARTVGPNRERVPLSADDKKAVADLDAQLDALTADMASWPATDGMVSTPWGDIHYAVDYGSGDEPQVVLAIGEQQTAMDLDDVDDLLTLDGTTPTTASLGQDNNPEFNRLHFRGPGGLFASKQGANVLAGVMQPRHAVTSKEHAELYGEEYDSVKSFDVDRIPDTDFGRSHGLGKSDRGVYVGLFGHSPSGVEGQVYTDVGDDEHLIVAMDGLDSDAMRELSFALDDMYSDDYEAEFEEHQALYPDQELDPGEVVLDEMQVNGFRVQRLGTGDLNIVEDDTDEDVMYVPMDHIADFQDSLDRMADSLDGILEDAAAEPTVAAATALPGELWHAVAHVEDISTGKRTWVPGAITWREPPFAFHTETQSSAHGSPMTTVQVGLVTRVARVGDAIHAWGTIDLDSDLGMDFARRLVQGFARWVSMDPDETPIAYDLVMPEGATSMDSEPEQVVFYSYRLAGLTSVSMPAQEGSYLEPTDALLEALMEPTTAAAVAPHDTPTTDKPWDADANVGRLPSPMPVETARKVFAWIDSSQVEDGMIRKEHLKMPHHVVSADGTPGAADLTACSAGIAALNGARNKPDIPAADFAGVYKHLAAHLRDAGREDIPTLSTGIDAHGDNINTCTCMGQDGKMIHPGRCDMRKGLAHGVEDAVEHAGPRTPKAPMGHGEKSKKLRAMLAEHVADLPKNRLEWSGADRRKAVAMEKAIKINDLQDELDGFEKRLGPKRLTWPRKERVRGREIDMELEKLLPKGTGVTVASNVHVLELPDLPPAEWFQEPLEMDAEPGGPIHVTDEGRVYGWLVPEGIGHRSYARQGQRKEFKDLGRIDFSRWLNETIVAGGTRVLAGPITMDCDHAPTQGYGTLKARNQHYENTCSIVGRVATGVGTRHKGQWIAGALMPWITPQQFTTLLASRMSGDWQPHPEKPGWQEFIAALVVPVPGWPGSRTGVTLASAAPVYSIREDADSCWVASASVPITAAGCGCYVIDDDEDVEPYDMDEDDDDEPWDTEEAPQVMPWRADPAILDMYASDLGLDKRSRMREYARMLG